MGNLVARLAAMRALLAELCTTCLAMSPEQRQVLEDDNTVQEQMHRMSNYVYQLKYAVDTANEDAK